MIRKASPQKISSRKMKEITITCSDQDNALIELLEYIKSNGNTSTAMVFEGNLISSPSFEGTDSVGYKFYVGNTAFTSSGAINAGIWYFVTCTFNKTTGVRNLYMNGELKSTNTSTTSSNITTIYFGARAASSLSFNGNIDQQRIFNIDLSANEVSQLYTSSKNLYK